MNYPNLDLYGNLKACEDNLLELINSNFFKLDSTWMVRAIDLVSELPSVASFGDIYILESGVYDYTYSIEIFDGVSWQSIEVKNGMHFWIESAKDFFYLEDGVLKTFAETYGDVTGPSSSLNHSIARFDGITGKFITDSNVIIDDNGNIFGIADIYSEALYSNHSEFNFSYSENLITENLTTNSILGKTTNAILNIDTIETTSIFNDLGIEFASEDIENISHSKNQASSLFLITNKSGDSVFLNKDGNIEYSKDGDLEILNGDTAFILYDLASNKYRVINTSSSDGSGGSRLNLLEDGSFEKGTDGWIVSSGSIDIEEEDLLVTPTNTKALTASVNPFSVLRKFLEVLNPSYQNVDGEISFLVKAFSNFDLVVSYVDGSSNVVELLNRPITGNSRWTYYQFPVKLIQTYDIRIFFSPVEEDSPSDLILDEVFFGAKHRPIKEEGVTYLSGDEFTDGSWRTVINLDGNLEFEKRVLGNWVYAGGFSI